jgi:hypothetical protein
MQKIARVELLPQIFLNDKRAVGKLCITMEGLFQVDDFDAIHTYILHLIIVIIIGPFCQDPCKGSFCPSTHPSHILNVLGQDQNASSPQMEPPHW